MEYALRSLSAHAVREVERPLSLEEYLTLEADLIHHSGVCRDEWLEMFSVLLRQILDEDTALVQRFLLGTDHDGVIHVIEKRLAKKRSEQIALGEVR